MSQGMHALFESAKPASGAAQAGIEAFKAILSSAREVGGELWDGVKPMVDHGRTEMAAALFSGHAHVMYMKGQEGIEQGQDQVPTPEPTQQKDIGGMER